MPVEARALVTARVPLNRHLRVRQRLGWFCGGWVIVDGRVEREAKEASTRDREGDSTLDLVRRQA